MKILLTTDNQFYLNNRFSKNRENFHPKVLSWLNWASASDFADACTYVVHENLVSGFFRYAIWNSEKFGKRLYARGTFVIKELRHQNIATKLWALAIKYHNIQEVSVCTVTKAGDNFIKQIQQEFPTVKFNTHFSV